MLEQKPAGPAVAGKAVRVRANLYFKRPKSHFKKDGSLKPSALAYVLKRPDVDNCLKFILDSLQPAVICLYFNSVADHRRQARGSRDGSEAVVQRRERREDGS